MRRSAQACPQSGAAHGSALVHAQHKDVPHVRTHVSCHMMWANPWAHVRRYNPFGQSRLREIFIKQDNLIHGRWVQGVG